MNVQKAKVLLCDYSIEDKKPKNSLCCYNQKSVFKKFPITSGIAGVVVK